MKNNQNVGKHKQKFLNMNSAKVFLFLGTIPCLHGSSIHCLQAATRWVFKRPCHQLLQIRNFVSNASWWVGGFNPFEFVKLDDFRTNWGKQKHIYIWIYLKPLPSRLWVDFTTSTPLRNTTSLCTAVVISICWIQRNCEFFHQQRPLVDIDEWQIRIRTNKNTSSKSDVDYKKNWRFGLNKILEKKTRLP